VNKGCVKPGHWAKSERRNTIRKIGEIKETVVWRRYAAMIR